MKSVGEVMALGRNFPECLQKALRMLAIGSEGVLCSPLKFNNKDEVETNIRVASPMRVFAIGEAFWKDYFTEQEVWEMSKIDHWFLGQIKRITDHAKKLHKAKKLEVDLVQEAKVLGFSDNEIARLTGSTFDKVRNLRKNSTIQPVTKQIDTLAAEFPAQTNYLYMSYVGKLDDV